MQPMKHKREQGHAVAWLGKQIIVIGGLWANSVEAFDLKKDAWTFLPNYYKLGKDATLMTIKLRYAIAVGGKYDYPEKYADSIVRLDTFKLHKGWEPLHLNEKLSLTGINQAAFMLEKNDDGISFLICGR